MGTPENAGVVEHFRPHVGPREGGGNVAISDFVPFDGTPKNAGVVEHFRPHVGPRDGKGNIATSDFVPFDGDRQERRGYAALPSSCGPPKKHR